MWARGNCPARQWNGDGLTLSEGKEEKTVKAMLSASSCQGCDVIYNFVSSLVCICLIQSGFIIFSCAPQSSHPLKDDWLKFVLKLLFESWQTRCSLPKRPWQAQSPVGTAWIVLPWSRMDLDGLNLLFTQESRCLITVWLRGRKGIEKPWCIKIARAMEMAVLSGCFMCSTGPFSV